MTDDSVRARWYSGQAVLDELARPLKSDPIEPKI